MESFLELSFTSFSFLFLLTLARCVLGAALGAGAGLRPHRSAGLE